MELYNFQKQSIHDLCYEGKHICVQDVGTGKSAVMMRWLANQNAKRVLIITTPSKRDSGDFLKDADTWNGKGWRESLEDFEIISWHGLAKWVKAHNGELWTWAFAFDEIQKAKAGVSSGMGKAFLNITINSSLWAGFTATPGDNWLHFYPYFTACGLVKNKTSFKREFAIAWMRWARRSRRRHPPMPVPFAVWRAYRPLRRRVRFTAVRAAVPCGSSSLWRCAWASPSPLRVVSDFCPVPWTSMSLSAQRTALTSAKTKPPSPCAAS